MSCNKKVSLIIINYNYSLYLENVVDSALSQTYNNIEVIVVDDGSTDDSLGILKKYNDKIKLLVQENSGMVEASNNGFINSSGDIIFFLDADDYLKNTAVEEVIKSWSDEIVKVHFRLEKRDDYNKYLGTVPPIEKKLCEGDVWSKILLNGDYNNVPTSGNAYCRKMLNNIFPIHNSKIGGGDSYLDRFPTDAYLKYRVPYFGNIAAIQIPLGVYRIHETNNGVSVSPYTNKLKRTRILHLAKLNTSFINSKLQIDDFISFYKRIKVIRLNAISFKIDGYDYLFNLQNVFRLYFKLAYLLYSSLKYKLFTLAYNLILIALIIFSPKKLVVLILKKLYN